MKLVCLTLLLLAVGSFAELTFTPETRARFEKLIHDAVDNKVHEDVVPAYVREQRVEQVVVAPVRRVTYNVVDDTKTDVLNFFEGFLQGVGSASIFDQIKVCIADVDSAANYIITGVEDIKTKEASKVEAGIALLGKAAQIVPDAAKTCEASVSDIEALAKFVKSFTTPESFLYYVGKSLLINHVEVISEVESAVTAFEQENYNQLGFYVGKAMDTILFGSSTEVISDTKANLLNFAEGFLEGVGSASAFDQVRACITDSEEVIQDITGGITDITTKNPSKVKEGIELLGQAAQIVPNAVQLCKAGGVDLQNLLKMVEAFKTPMSFLYYVGKSLLINHVEVIHEIENAVSAYQQGNWNQLGYAVGQAMDTIILGGDQTLNQKFADHLNKVSGWKASVPSKFEGMTYQEIKQRYLGTEMIDYKTIENITEFNYEGLINDIPAYFNSSEQWPGCVHPIRDQQQCGSCWAFGASEALSDRFCIASGGKTNVVLSPQYLLSCNNILNHGCNGGNPLFAWWFMADTGMLTDDCLPYQSGSGTNPVTCKSVTKCADGSALKKYYSKKSSTVTLTNPASIQANILQYGPVEAAFQVYQDFMYYSGGIYKHTSGSLEGGHAVKIIGWGNENGTDFWIVANSWGTSWGENGFFRIAFGQCGIDSSCVAGQADTTRAEQTETDMWWN